MHNAASAFQPAAGCWLINWSTSCNFEDGLVFSLQ
jgi:hypothetical protein